MQLEPYQSFVEVDLAARVKGRGMELEEEAPPLARSLLVRWIAIPVQEHGFNPSTKSRTRLDGTCIG